MNNKNSIVVFHWRNGDGIYFPDDVRPPDGIRESDPNWRKLTQLFGETWQLVGYDLIEVRRRCEWLKVRVFEDGNGVDLYKETVIVFIGPEENLLHFFNYPTRQRGYRSSFVSATAVEVYDSTQPIGTGVGGLVRPEKVTRLSLPPEKVTRR